MDLLWGQTSTLETHGLRVEEGGGDGSERVAGGIDYGDRRVVLEGAQTIAGLGRCRTFQVTLGLRLGCRRCLCRQIRHISGGYCPHSET